MWISVAFLILPIEDVTDWVKLVAAVLTLIGAVLGIVLQARAARRKPPGVRNGPACRHHDDQDVAA